MNEIHRPQECINANCVNTCSIAQYEGFKHWFGNNPKKCPSYKKSEPISVVDELEKIKTEIKELKSDSDYYEWYGIRRTVNIINKHISELKGEEKE